MLLWSELVYYPLSRTLIFSFKKTTTTTQHMPLFHSSLSPSLVFFITPVPWQPRWDDSCIITGIRMYYTFCSSLRFCHFWIQIKLPYSCLPFSSPSPTLIPTLSWCQHQKTPIHSHITKKKTQTHFLTFQSGGSWAPNPSAGNILSLRKENSDHMSTNPNNV